MNHGIGATPDARGAHPSPGARTASVLEVRDLDVSAGDRPIVRGLSLSVAAGETAAIVGESGSGKSLAARAMIGLLPPALSARGTVRLGGARDGTDRASLDLARSREADWDGLRGRRIALLLQDPFTSLSPVHTVGRQIADTVSAARRTGRGRRTFGDAGRLRRLVSERLSEVSLPERVAAQYPHQLSGGMRQRAAIAAALAADPDVLLADEPTTALDASTQGGILELLAELQRSRGLAVVLISHDLDLVRGYAASTTVLLAGSVVERGATADVLERPLHPYTAGLLAASTSIDHRADRLPTVPWIETAEHRPPPGLTFGDGYAEAARVREVPPPRLLRIEDGREKGREVAAYEAGAPLPRVRPVAADPRPEPSAPAGTAETAEGPAGEVVLRVARLTKSFGAATALDDVSFELERGEVLGIVGESGSGKTTLARCIVGLEQAERGTIETPGGAGARAAARRTAPRSAAARRAAGSGAVQIVFQDPASALNPAHTVGFALREVLRIAGRDPGGTGALLERVGLPAAFATRRPGDLSGGQRQRVAIARALALEPEILICDESVSALDVSVQAQILNLLSELRRSERLSLLFISHDLGVINQLADRVLVLLDGRVVESGPRRDVLSAPQHAYTRQLIDDARPAPAFHPARPDDRPDPQEIP
ncbi:ABC transporter ATP-binding protein [Leucobacter weissii]|uniref:ABC transporter ATP-binding protein n=1 Tax=Leucobacter weissii TaxID=1983706 RepID=A0A939SAK5_9MICO|nr:ABC transporter ATP-binding protein [Leucobacter weissii]MBO1900508.1 ABC transporter ATP-binding protein [Leucobacter weissii]